MNILLISGSLNPVSKSWLLVQQAEIFLKQAQIKTTTIDLRKYDLPFCDADVAYEHPQVKELASLIQHADAVLMGVPIYNFDINAALKNLVELTGSAWENKIVGFLCAAGGRSSYMSVANFGNDLMFDFRCLIVPRFIYAVGSDFDNHQIINPEITHRIEKLIQETLLITATGYSKIT